MLYVVSCMNKDIVHPAYDSIKVLWNISSAELISKGKWLKQKQPKGVIKVVNNFDSSSKGICQKPVLASNFMNILLSPSMARLLSTEPMGWVLRCTALFSGVRSTQIRTRPLGFGTGTMPEHHSVGMVTGEMTPCQTRAFHYLAPQSNWSPCC